MKVTLWLLLAMLWAQPGAAADLHIASAANFRSTLEQLLQDFPASNQEIAVSYASTGALYAQIRHGAPFDILLAADVATPARLASDGLAEAASRRTYARGQLALVYQPHLEALAKQGPLSILRQPQLTLAVANPHLAPYGRAAASVLEKLPSATRPQVITGTNILQAYQLWYSGGADAALIARSMAPENYLPIPAQWHEPIDQQVILLNGGNENALAARFLTYLASDRAQEIILADGYLDPGISDE
ncbi:molybdate ABC transporter substrate-binding protein [Halieaceae bacterium IMCC14734]|uniref:Molybdate ABC transporter substrate-binding protein n=1 Tax=Candidatus Litorirhabdus singularis TaxID=2518993 RepID=A0ABT3TBV5_9GAMM|nr:molybdate ABC transporter substrate-binding protein [Candidatus Litorirhabdus singularis]MCX2979762.1 molybdate ABC transporter substrate-binding protein [Candidatus Litorirhabdus singularis]